MIKYSKPKKQSVFLFSPEQEVKTQKVEISNKASRVFWKQKFKTHFAKSLGDFLQKSHWENKEKVKTYVSPNQGPR